MKVSQPQKGCAFKALTIWPAADAVPPGDDVERLQGLDLVAEIRAPGEIEGVTTSEAGEIGEMLTFPRYPEK